MKPSSLPLMVLALVGCADGSRGTEPIVRAPTPPFPIVAGMRATVDVTASTLTFEPPPGASLSRGHATDARLSGIYGDQGVTVRLYNSPVTVAPSATPGKETYTADVGLRNLLAFPIGDEQAGATPADTMGIYVFVTSGPTVTATSSPCSPACTVTAQNNQGTLAFTAPGQRYWHWSERVGAVGSGADTTRARRTWIFQADTQVTAFNFEVLVSAAWASPNETRWKVDFQGDSIPHTTSEPRWRRTSTGAAGTVTLNSPSAGIITITTPDRASHWFSRRDSLASASNAYVEARFRSNILTGRPEISFGIDDDTKFIAVGVNDISVGFLATDFGFLGNEIATTPNSFHTYRIRKFAADSVQLLLDGIRVDSRTYSSFQNSTNTTVPSFFYFGGPGDGDPPESNGGNSSSWDYVIYEIGATQP